MLMKPIEEEKKMIPMIDNKAKITEIDAPHPAQPSVQRFNRI